MSFTPPGASGATMTAFSGKIRQRRTSFFCWPSLADEQGEVRFETPFPEKEIQSLMAARFDDCRAYQLSGGPKR